MLHTNYSRSLNFFYITFSVCYSPVATVQLTSLLRKRILGHLDPGEGNEAVEAHNQAFFVSFVKSYSVWVKTMKGISGVSPEAHPKVCVNRPFPEVLRQGPEQREPHGSAVR